MQTTTQRPTLRVFLVEDAPGIRSRLAAMLTALPDVALVGEAESVTEAIAGITTTRPDAVVLDLQIIGGSGLEVLKACRAVLPNLRVAVLTNFATDQHRRACLAAGAEHFLDKSSEFPRIRSIMADWVDGAAAVAG
jgi:DNA-binding NarL/FixJ family response regulator